jgi:hypothetical protein
MTCLRSTAISRGGVRRFLHPAAMPSVAQITGLVLNKSRLFNIRRMKRLADQLQRRNRKAVQFSAMWNFLLKDFSCIIVGPIMSIGSEPACEWSFDFAKRKNQRE